MTHFVRSPEIVDEATITHTCGESTILLRTYDEKKITEKIKSKNLGPFPLFIRFFVYRCIFEKIYYKRSYSDRYQKQHYIETCNIEKLNSRYPINRPKQYQKPKSQND